MHAQSRNRNAFTLIELLVVVAIIALLISILLPSLAKAREQTKSVKCLANLRTTGQAIMTYTVDERGSLPGPLHPAVYRNQGIDALLDAGVSMANALREQQRFLTFKLRKQMGDTEGRANSVTDQVTTCPTLTQVNPDSNFRAYKAATARFVHPIHYALNNIAPNNVVSPEAGGSGFNGNQRETNPPNYFGYSQFSGQSGGDAIEKRFPPQPIERIKRPSDEWAMADAWYRARQSSSTYLQQEGTYQVGWTGEALPNFAPHFAKLSSYSYTTNRDVEAANIRKGKMDGRTNTMFFDGHAAPVASKRRMAGGFELLYGFSGTVNVPDAAYKDNGFKNSAWE